MHSLRFCGTSIVTFPNGGGQGACKAKRISNRARKKAGTDRRTGRRNNKTMGATSHITVYKHHTNHTKAAAAEL